MVLLSSPPPVLQDAPSQDSPLPLVLSADQQSIDGFHALLPLLDDQRLQVFSLDAEPLATIIPLTLEGFDRLAAVYRLLAHLHGRSVPPDARLTRQQRARARRMLQAIDGLRSGATQQEIAQSLFRIKRLGRSEWQVSPIRHSVMSLLRDARSMISGGYRKLLRHRRKP